jgi:4-hydroxy-2-oxoheptanedioate aldolase
LAVPGIDAIFPRARPICRSPCRAGRPRRRGAEVEKALGHAQARAKAAGKLAAVYAATGERAANSSDAASR